MGDAELVGRWLRGDREALGGLIERYWADVFGICLSVLGEGAAAEDAAQETFVKVALRARRFRAERAFAPWLRTIAFNTARDLRRRRRRRARREATVAARRPVVQREDAADVAAERIAADALPAHVADLSEKLRAAIRLRYYEGLALDEIARRLDCPLPTAASRIRRGLERLRRSMRGAGLALAGAPLFLLRDAHRGRLARPLAAASALISVGVISLLALGRTTPAGGEPPAAVAPRVVEGSVVDPAGRPIPRASVALAQGARLYAARAVPQATTDDVGRFAMPLHPPPGAAARLVVSARGFRPRAIAQAPDGAGPGRVVLEPGGARLNGCVRFAPDGAPAAQAQVIGVQPGVAVVTRTDALGRFALDLAPGLADVVVRGAGGETIARREEVSVRDGTTLDLSVNARASLSLRVLEADGRPAAAWVRLRAEPDERRDALHAGDRPGALLIDGLSPARWTLEVRRGRDTRRIEPDLVRNVRLHRGERRILDLVLPPADR